MFLDQGGKVRVRVYLINHEFLQDFGQRPGDTLVKGDLGGYATTDTCLPAYTPIAGLKFHRHPADRAVCQLLGDATHIDNGGHAEGQIDGQGSLR